MNRTKRVAIVALLLGSISLTSCSAEPESDGTGEGTEQVESIASDLEAPWEIAFYDETVLVSERDSARILELDAGGTAREVNIIDGVSPQGEGGLLGIAVEGNSLYAYSTGSDTNRIERYEIAGEPGALSLGEAELLLDGIPAASIHNGGRIAFGPDGMLYVTTGDAGQPSAAQDLDSLGGKILRMTPDGAVPDDNPFEGSYVYSWGHRNPQGIAWDDNGVMYASEFGQNTWDELNVIEPGGNYGWPAVEGIGNDDRYIDPVQQWEPASASPSGIAIDSESIWVANLRGARLREIPLDDVTTSIDHWTDEQGRLRTVAITPDGDIWVLTNNTDGRGSPGPDDDRILKFTKPS